MTVSALSGGQSQWENVRQRRAALQQMQAAVQSGDIKAAQQSLATVKQLSTPAAPDKSQGGADGKGDASASHPFRSTMKADLSALEASITSADLISTQGAFSDLDVHKVAPAPQNPGPDEDPGAKLATDMINLIDAVLKGDAQATQKAATALQSDLTKALGPEPDTTHGPVGGPVSEESTSGKSSLIDDLKALLTAGKGTDANATQKAAQKFLQDLQQAASGVQGGGHHHQGHHAHAAAQYEQTVSITSITVTSAPVPTATTDTAATS